jgi:toxin-antitoxin system PIN domain toxin
MSLLLDGNILTAFVIDTHMHHQRVKHWFGTLSEEFATCVITQGTLLRLHMQLASDTSARAAWAALDRVRNHPRHVFWPETFGYEGVQTTRVQGHRQVTDAWLAEFARRRGGKLATMDHGLATDQSDVAVLIP